MVYDSVYEANNYLRGTVRKQHFWENFSGSKLQEAPAVATSDDLTTNNGWVFPTNSSYDSTNDQIDLTIASNSFDVSYIDLQKAVYFGSGNNLNDDNFVIRAKITKNNDLGNTSKGSSLLLQVSSALTDSSKSPNPQDAVGMRIDTDRLYGQNKFFVHSTVNGRFWDGESSGISYSWGTGDLYWEIIGDGTNVTGELFTGSDYSTGSLGKVTTSQQSPTGMRYLKFCGFVDPSRTATQFSLQEFTIWNGVSNTDDVGIRWTTNDITGTGTFAMADSVDGGFSIKAGATTGNASGIDFNDIRQYAHDGSVNIAVWKRVTDTKTDVYTGFSSVLGLSVLNSAWAVQLNNVTNLLLWTGDASAGSQAQTDIPRDIIYHTTKLECGSDDIKLTVDGVLKVTKTTNRPTVKLQPVCFVESRDATAREGRIRYMECYNT